MFDETCLRMTVKVIYVVHENGYSKDTAVLTKLSICACFNPYPANVENKVSS